MRIIHCQLHLCDICLPTSTRAIFLVRAIPNDGRYTRCKPLPQFLWRFPNNVIVLACIEMDVFSNASSLQVKNDLNPESMCKAGFVIDTPARPVLSLGKISDNKARASDFGNDLGRLSYCYVLADQFGLLHILHLLFRV